MCVCVCVAEGDGGTHTHTHKHTHTDKAIPCFDSTQNYLIHSENYSLVTKHPIIQFQILHNSYCSLIALVCNTLWACNTPTIRYLMIV